MHESPKRSLAKTITWRIIAVVITWIALMFVMSTVEATIWTAIIHGVKTAAYYFHERFWDRINWGRF